MVFQPGLQRAGIVLDHDEAALRLGELARHVAADAADAADDVVALQPGDQVFHAASPEGGIEVGLDQQRQEGREQVAQAGDAHQRDEDGEQPAVRMRGQVDDLAVADRGHGDEGHVEAVDPAGAWPADPVIAQRAHDVDQQQHDAAVGQAAEVSVAKEFDQAPILAASGGGTLDLAQMRATRARASLARLTL